MNGLKTIRKRQKTPSTSVDVARLAGVGQATVSRAINNPAAVSKTTLVKIEKAMASLNYKPSALARGLVRGRNGVIGLLATQDDFTAHRFGMVVEGISEVLNTEEYLLTITTHLPKVPLEKWENSSLVKQHSCDGLILDLGLSVEDLTAFRKKLTVPHVLVNPTAYQTHDSVMFNDQSAAELAVRYLVSRGHRRIAYLTSGSTHASGEARERGYEIAMYRAGLVPMPFFNQRPPALPTEREAKYQARLHYMGQYMEKWLNDSEPATAVLTYDASTAIHISHLAYLKNWKIPAAFSLLACDDENPLERAALPITAVCLGRAEMGTRACRMLLEKIADPDKQIPTHFVEGKLVERQSVAQVG
jgi:DNA-binding LacI/PurR family transcriptional regulator